MTTDIANLLPWGPPTRVFTKRGERQLRKAEPDARFWILWESRRAELSAAGVVPGKKFKGGPNDWEICWWQAMTAEEAAKQEAAKAASKAVDADVEIPAPDGLAYLGYQKAGVAFALARPGTLIADEMGLGKTIQAIGVINADPKIQKVCIICPASLKINWHRELSKWLVRPLTVGIVEPDCWPTTDIAIVNFDIIHKYEKRASFWWDLLVIDEAHYLKSQTARRTKHILGYKPSAKAVKAAADPDATETQRKNAQGRTPIPARRKLFMTGTPIVNRPQEIFPLIHNLCPTEFPDFFRFAKRYCNPPEAPVLMADYSFRPIGEVKQGDEIIGWKKEPAGRRSKAGKPKDVLAKATVLQVHRRVAPIVKVLLASGKQIRCTKDHRWLNGGNWSTHAMWTTPNIGREFVRVVDEVANLDPAMERDAGWLAGIYDGEGTWPFIAQSKAVNAGVHERICQTLTKLGFEFTATDEGVRVVGGRQAALRFISLVRPRKTEYLEKHILTGRFRTPDEVVGVWPDGEGEVVAMTTSTGNYIAWGFASKNCNATQNGFGWDFSGASNLAELQDRLRQTCMVRRLKKDVLTELPAKVRSVIELPSEGLEAVSKEAVAARAHESKIVALKVAVELSKAEGEDQYKAAVEAMREGMTASFTELAKLRHDTAIAKLPLVIEALTEELEEVPKLLVFAHHRDVLEAIRDAFPGAALVYGGMTGEDKMREVDRFQKRPDCRVFAGQFDAAGVGLTLTAASLVCFAEEDWVPGKISQCEDRAHRIGQKDCVMVKHLVLAGSLDVEIARQNVAKQTVIDAALDKVRDEMAAEPIVPFIKGPPSVSATRDQIARDAAKLTSGQIAATHTALKMLAGMCDGAAKLDGAGFSKVDAAIGHSLAERLFLTPKQAALGQRIARKYKRQLPAATLADCGIL